jgi:hypothetical protein
MRYNRLLLTILILVAVGIVPLQQVFAVPQKVGPVQTSTLLTFQSLAGQDGWILESGETTGVGGTLNATDLVIKVGDNEQDRQLRSLVAFNTGALPDNAIVLSATLKLKKRTGAGSSPFTTHGKLLVEIRNPFFGNAATLELNDFQAAAGQTPAGTVQTTPVDGYFIANLNNAALAHINEAGFTQLRLRFQMDDNNDMAADYLAFHSGSATTVAFRPILEVTYILPNTATPTSTITLTPTVTPSNTSTSTHTSTSTSTPTITPTETITLTPSDTPTITITPTITLTSAFSETPTATITPTDTETSTPTLTKTITPTPTIRCFDCPGG